MVQTATEPATEEVAPAPDGPIVLDRYRLTERLGGGGMGVVWRAEDLKLGRPVAIKRIACDDAETARRADRETVAAARLQHPAIVSLYESVAHDEQVWLVSELVEGETLAAALRGGSLSDLDILNIGRCLCDALAHAHRQGVVHRDVKPQNILVPFDHSRRGQTPAKLTDFGIAQLADDDVLTRTGDVVGTLAYMAPEQAEGRGAGPEADVYALGLCLYEALSGVNPVRGRGVGATARRVGQQLPELGRLRRDLPLELCDAIDDAVWPDPEERLTLRELRSSLAAALGEVSDEPGTVAGAPVETIAGMPDAALTIRSRSSRVVAAAAVIPIAVAVILRAAEQPPAQALWVAPPVAALLVLASPRIGWLLTAAASVVLLAATGDGWALPAAAVVLPVPVLLRRAEPWSWSLPAFGVGLGVLGAPLAAPALAVRIAAPLHRAAAGLLSAWWLIVAQLVSGQGLVPGVATVPGGSTGPDDDALAALVSSPALMFAAVCAAGAVLGPWLVGAASAKLAVLGALLWATALAVVLGVQAPSSALELAAGAAIAAAVIVLLRPSPSSSADVPLP